MIRKWEPTLVLGPDDEGREMTLEEFDRTIGTEGYRYELIDGRVEVSPQAQQPHDSIEVWLLEQFIFYRYRRPEIANYVTTKARIFVPGRTRATCPEPDVAVYESYPYHLPRRERDWRLLSPILVVEILSETTTAKDLERNVALYREVPSIREYWIVDPREDADSPSLIVYRRRGAKWQKPILVAPGETYTTKLLPEFELRLEAPSEEA